MARHVRVGFIVLLIAVMIWTCGGTLFSGSARARSRLLVYGFSILAEPLREEVFPLFRERWLAETGADVEILDSFAASGTIANQIVNGTPAHVAILSHPGDADRIVAAGRASSDWRAGAHEGILNRTPVVIMTRPGNPKGVRAFADLGRLDLTIVHPDPLTSGGAQWAILAEYAEPLILARAAGRAESPEVAYAQLLAVWRNVVAQAPSARAARTQFDGGFGDVLVTYEVEALRDLARGHPVDVVVPEATILCEHPVVLVDRNVRPEERRLVAAFVEFLHSDEAQRAFVRHGFRSARPELDRENPRLHRVAHAYTAADLGGFTRAQREVVEVAWRSRALLEARR